MANELENMADAAKKTVAVLTHTTTLFKKFNSQLSSTNSVLTQFGRSIRTLTTQQRQLSNMFVCVQANSYAAAVALCVLDYYSYKLSVTLSNVNKVLTNFNFKLGDFNLKPTLDFSLKPTFDFNLKPTLDFNIKPNFDFKIGPLVEINSFSASLSNTFNNLIQNFSQFNITLSVLIKNISESNFFNNNIFIKIETAITSISITFTSLQNTIYNLNLAFNLLIDKLNSFNIANIFSLNSFSFGTQNLPIQKSNNGIIFDNLTEIKIAFDSFAKNIFNTLFYVTNQLISLIKNYNNTIFSSINFTKELINKNIKLTINVDTIESSIKKSDGSGIFDLIQSSFTSILKEKTKSIISDFSGKVFKELLGENLISSLEIFGDILASVAATGLKIFGTKMLWVGKIMLTNPIGLAITGIALAAGLLYIYWEPIKEFFSNLWSNITSRFSSVFDFFAFVINNFSPLGLFYKMFAGVMEFLGVSMPATFTEFGGLLIGSLIDGLVEKFPALGKIVEGVKDFFGIGSDEDKNKSEESPPKLGKALEESQPLGATSAKATFAPTGKTTLTTDAAGGEANNFEPPPLPNKQSQSRGAPGTGKARAIGGGASTGNQELGLTVNHAPIINIECINPDAIRNQVMLALKTGQQELEQMISRIMAQQARRAY